MRDEKCHRILAEVEEEHEKAVANNQSSSFDPKRPWNTVFRRVVEGKDEAMWWFKHVDRPGMYITNRVAKEDDFLDGDVAVAPTSTDRAHHLNDLEGSSVPFATRQNKRKQPVVQYSPPSSSYSIPTTTSYGPPAPATDPHDYSEHDGQRWVKTRTNLKFCRGWQIGKCVRTVNGNRCGMNPEEVHQCSYCKQTGHGESTCWAKLKGKGKGDTGADAAPSGKGNKAKGKGKGKGKSKRAN